MEGKMSIHTPSQNHQQKSEFYTGIILWLLVLIAVATAIWAGARFHAAGHEGGESNFEYIVRYTDVEFFSWRVEMSVPETLVFLKEQGVTSIGIFEYTLWSLRKETGAYVLSNSELAGELSFNTDLATYSDFLQDIAQREGLRHGDYLVFMPGGPWAEQVWDHLGQLRVVENPALLRLKRFAHEDMELFLIQGARYDYLPQLALGAHPVHLANVSAAGLRVNPYLSARQIVTATSFEQALATYDNALISPVLFEGGVVHGYPRFTAQTAAALNKRNLSAMVYEYHDYPSGMKELAPLIDYNLAVMIPESRFFPTELEIVNSSRERKAQAIEFGLRNFAPGLKGVELQEELSRQMHALHEGRLRDLGLSPGALQLHKPQPMPQAAFLLMGLGLVAFTLIFLRLFLPVRPLYLLLLLIPGLAVIYLLFSRNQIITAQMLALWVAVIFPSFPFLTFFQNNKESSDNPLQMSSTVYCPVARAFSWAFMGRSVLQICAVFLFSLAGGVLLHGLLTLPPFFSGLEFFRGVKVMYILPLFIVGLAAFLSSSPTAGDRNTESRSLSGVRLLPDGTLGKTFLAAAKPVLQRPLTMGDVLLLGALLLIAFIYLTRTGHVLSINPAESQARDLLETILGVRPRFKEFLIGYPLALLGLYLTSRPQRPSQPQQPGASSSQPQAEGKTLLALLPRLILAASVLVPISILNTFAHIQAPLALSLWRSLHGFWLGVIAALILLLVWTLVERQLNK